LSNFLRRAAVVVTAATVCAVTFSASAAHAAITASSVYHSTNWGGYYAATGGKPVYGVGAEWAVPSANCADSRGSAPFIASTWVGVGGLASSAWPNASNSLLEQDGITVTCATTHSQPVYQPFWEVFDINNEQHWGNAQVHAGDLISAWVAAPDGSPRPGEWYFEVADFTSGKTWGEYYKLPASDNKYTFKTVEAITEWDKGTYCATGKAGNTCRKTGGKKGYIRKGFAYVGQVNYTDAYWQTSGEELLPIAKSRISMYPDVGRVAAITATNPTTSEGSDITGDSFSTNYTRFWYTDF
jgi:hypothetical protein